MMKKRIFIAAAAIAVTLAAGAARKPAYKDASKSTDERVADLLPRMTVEEKVGQLLCPFGWDMWTIQGNNVVPSEQFVKEVTEHNTGMLWGAYRADPWTRKTLDNGLNPELAAKAGNALQRYMMENTRLGIPIFLAEEAPHGHMAIGATVFPTGIGMAATWNPELIESVGRVIGNEVRSQGAHISYGPVLDLTRDPRWSRVEETYGEDPVLAGALGAAMVRGLGAGKISDPDATIATLKHFLAYAVPEGGQNGNYSVVGPRELKQMFLPPFRDAVDAGALSIMTSYNSIDGVPCTMNRELLTDMLRGEWGFNGFVVSDLFSIDGMWETHFVAPTLADAGRMALEAGVDVDLGSKAYKAIVDDLNSGKIPMAELDKAVERVLRLKFDMGLFDNPYVDPAKSKAAVRSAAHEAVALDAARQSITLLENRNNTLPLNAEGLKVAVVGPNADVAYNQLGDYTAPQADGVVRTVLDGVRSKLPEAQVLYAKGCAVRDTANSDIAAAVDAALASDVVIAVVGGSSARDFKTEYKDTGAAEVDVNSVSDMESGEGYDRATLTLMGRQEELLKALKATGKPLVVVYIEGRPLDKRWAAENADALLTAYYPGAMGGVAVADVIFGEYNPAGRLPITTPRSVGQIPIYYNKKAPVNHNYVEELATPLYPFGYGLSYTTFDYSDLAVTPRGDGGADVAITVTNTGSRKGDEVVQLYVRDMVASVSQPMKQLKKFERVELAPGESRRISMPLNRKDLELIGPDMKAVFEPGEFTIMVGSSSADIRQSQTVTL